MCTLIDLLGSACSIIGGSFQMDGRCPRQPPFQMGPGQAKHNNLFKCDEVYGQRRNFFFLLSADKGVVQTWAERGGQLARVNVCVL